MATKFNIIFCFIGLSNGWLAICSLVVLLQERSSTDQEELAVCFDEGAGIESSELRKRGLCLVSVSMLTNLM